MEDRRAKGRGDRKRQESGSGLSTLFFESVASSSLSNSYDTLGPLAPSLWSAVTFPLSKTSCAPLKVEPSCAGFSMNESVPGGNLGSVGVNAPWGAPPSTRDPTEAV